MSRNIDYDEQEKYLKANEKNVDQAIKDGNYGWAHVLLFRAKELLQDSEEK